MRRFLVKISMFVIIVSVIIVGWCWFQRNDILVMTNSISLDTRIHEMRSISEEHFDVVGLGSSMTLYQFDGKTFVDNLDKEVSLYNFSAWGLSMSDDERLLGYIIDRYSPYTVVMFSNIIDFSEGESIINISEISDYLDNNPLNDIKLILDYGFPNNIETKNLYYDRRFEPTELNEDLRYDQWGGVRLNVYGEDILKVRYDSTYKDTPKDVQYDALEAMVSLCNEKGIGFYFVQTPYRSHYLSEEGAQEIFDEHLSRCQSTVVENGGHYLNLANLDKYSDEYFADSVHINEVGAIMLTEEFTQWFIEISDEEKDIYERKE